MKNTTLNKVTICSNKKFRDLIIEKAKIKDAKTIAVAYWETPALYYDIKRKYPEKDVYYIENEENKCLYGDIENAIYVKSEEEFPDMYFDRIIMNPPYGRMLPVDILIKAYNHLNDDGIVVSLQPDTKFKSITETNSKIKLIQPHIQNYECFYKAEGNKLFNINMATDLGIFTIKKNGNYNTNLLQYSEFEDLYQKIHAIKNWRTACSKLGPLENSLPMQGDNGYYKGAGLTHRELLHGNCAARLYFDSKDSLDNFLSSLDTWVYKLIFKLDNNSAVPAHSPFMVDEINPRTGLKGYASTWTDNDFYTIFEVDENLKTQIKKVISNDIK